MSAGTCEPSRMGPRGKGGFVGSTKTTSTPGEEAVWFRFWLRPWRRMGVSQLAIPMPVPGLRRLPRMSATFDMGEERKVVVSVDP